MTRYQKPGKEAFYSDMNKHARADYRHVGERYILEVDPFPAGDRLIVWEAVRQGGEYVRPSDGNSFEWDAVGSEMFHSREEAREEMNKINGVHGVRTWCKLHPYEGPRTPWSEQVRGESDA